MRLTAALASGALVLLCNAATHGQSWNPASSEELLERRGDVGAINGRPVNDAVSSILVLAKVPGGAAILSGCAPEPGKETVVSGPTLRDALEAILKADPRYRWEIDDGIVNLVPSEANPSLLDVSIHDFDSQDATSPTWALDLLFRSSEVQQAMLKLGFISGPTPVQVGMEEAALPGSGPPKPKPRLSVHLRDATVRQVMNAIVRANGGGVWVYHESYCGGNGQFKVTFSK